MLPAPNLDDRTFQSLVDDARRHVHRHCPQWSDHNISDPGITLIETFAMMVDQLIYRLNQVPDRNYIKFLDMLGLELRAPGAAQGEVTFWLSAAQRHTITVRAETEVSTDRSDVTDPIVFSTTEQLDIVACSLDTGRVATAGAGSEPRPRLNGSAGDEFPCFSERPSPGDALLIGLDRAVPSCAVSLRVDCRVSGVGVDPNDPPYEWEAWTDQGWARCETERDETRAFNQLGHVVLHVPRGHLLDSPREIGGKPQGWLRCRLKDGVPGQHTYQESPLIKSISAQTVGGTVPIVQARVIRGESIGTSDGTPGQRFALRHNPVLPWPHCTLTVTADGETTEWHPVDDFGGQNATSRCFHIDPVNGKVVFGPSVREADGRLSQYGQIPPKSASLTMAAYRTGGGTQGNVGVRQIRVLKTSVPYVERVENRRAAVGGAAAETVEDLKNRGPMLLRSHGKAVTAQDFEQLTREKAPGIARAHCLTATDDRDAGLVRVLIVPHVSSDAMGMVRREDLDPLPATVDTIREHLDERRVIGCRVAVQAPTYVGVTVVATVGALPGCAQDRLTGDIQRELNRFLHPLTGGPDGRGWPLGHPLSANQIAAALAWVPGLNTGEDITIQLFPVNPATGERARQPVDRIPLARDALVYSFGRHSIRVR
ncbi:putative baseplate assembly protein [Mycobacterium sp. Y57]|uniref:putative baseplate assembly protein n=1 Tax=Mycolicibacterium xanthum TaxID=2796469 RepID=UPI001C847726|nr:putative baseplate assembly protein [Mycolicibacterium xanthum]MBX7432764.1 putative baseplate assembly protein [Mycolicibacterium xanthum]